MCGCQKGLAKRSFNPILISQTVADVLNSQNSIQAVIPKNIKPIKK